MRPNRIRDGNAVPETTGNALKQTKRLTDMVIAILVLIAVAAIVVGAFVCRGVHDIVADARQPRAGLR